MISKTNYFATCICQLRILPGGMNMVDLMI